MSLALAPIPNQPGGEADRPALTIAHPPTTKADTMHDTQTPDTITHRSHSTAVHTTEPAPLAEALRAVIDRLLPTIARDVNLPTVATSLASHHTGAVTIDGPDGDVIAIRSDDTTAAQQLIAVLSLIECDWVGNDGEWALFASDVELAGSPRRLAGDGPVARVERAVDRLERAMVRSPGL